MNVTKIELCTRVAKRTRTDPKIANNLKNISIPELKTILELYLDEILNSMAEGYRLEIRGFGSFKIDTTKKRVGRNPRTGDLVEIPSFKKPKFKFSREAKELFVAKMEQTLQVPERGQVLTATKK